MGLFLRANNLNSTKELNSHKRGLFQRSLEYSTPEPEPTMGEALTGTSIIEIIEEKDDFQVDQDLKLNEIEIYEEIDFSTNSDTLVNYNKNPVEKKIDNQKFKSQVNDLSNSGQLSDYFISEINDFKDELSHQLIRSLEKGKAFFLVKISIKTISNFLNNLVSLNEQLKVFQNLLIDMGKAYFFEPYQVILVINKMYKPDPVIFIHQFRSAIKRNIIELENLNDLEFNPVVRVFPEHGKTVEKLIDGLFD